MHFVETQNLPNIYGVSVRATDCATWPVWSKRPETRTCNTCRHRHGLYRCRLPRLRNERSARHPSHHERKNSPGWCQTETLVYSRTDQDHEGSSGGSSCFIQQTATKHLWENRCRSRQRHRGTEIFLRAIEYGKENYPEKNKEEQWERFSEHMEEKYSRNGYIKLWIPNSPNEKALKELRNIIEHKSMLRKEFEKDIRRNREQETIITIWVEQKIFRKNSIKIW